MGGRAEGRIHRGSPRPVTHLGQRASLEGQLKLALSRFSSLKMTRVAEYTFEAP